jgi:DNA polymerase-3 subunit delta'
VSSCFDAVLGQESAIEKLKIVLRSKQVPQALIFKGPSGCGKKKTAICFAAARLCDTSPEGCGVCPSCKRVFAGQSESVMFIEPVNNVIKIEQAREILNSLSLANWAGSRFVIVNDAHMMNPQAANALLKIIEEPPQDTHFIFITDNIQSMLATIRSRCQSLMFQALTPSVLRTLGAQEDWMVHASRGSAEKLMAFQNPEMQEARKVAHQVMNAPLDVELSALDRETSLLVLRFLQMDIAQSTKKELKNLDQNATNARWLAETFQSALQSEKDILANCDAKLTMDVFLRGLQEGVRA